MSTFQPKPGTFSLFLNDYKKSDAQPDMRGTGLDLNGNEIEFACWQKVSKNGKKFLSCVFGPPRPRDGQPQQAQQTLPMDDAPF